MDRKKRLVNGFVNETYLSTDSSSAQWTCVIDPSSIAFGVYVDANNGILIPAYDGESVKNSISRQWE